MVKENTESKSDVRSEAETRVSKAAKILEHNSQEKQRQRNKRVNRTNGIILGFNVAFSIFGAIVGAWSVPITMLGYSLWLGIVWVQERHMNELRFIIDMQQGLHDIESKELELAMQEQPKKPTAKGKK